MADRYRVEKQREGRLKYEKVKQEVYTILNSASNILIGLGESIEKEQKTAKTKRPSSYKEGEELGLYGKQLSGLRDSVRGTVEQLRKVNLALALHDNGINASGILNDTLNHYLFLEYFSGTKFVNDAQRARNLIKQALNTLYEWQRKVEE
ncbi:MAG: hypothetical protein AABX59_00690 [Nanoarchaeota archaeon]